MIFKDDISPVPHTWKGIIRVQLNNLIDKINIMENKSKLHGEDTFKDNDMTKIERYHVRKKKEKKEIQRRSVTKRS